MLDGAQLSQATINKKPSENRIVKQLPFYYRYVRRIYMGSTLPQWSAGTSRNYNS